MYNSISLPNLHNPMTELASSYGKTSLTIEGIFYNASSNVILSKNAKELTIFLIYPLARVILVSLITIISGVAWFGRRTKINLKNVWEKTK